MYSTGATVISKPLMNNCIIQVLNVYGNNIGVEGARVILQSAVNNEACKAYIRIDGEYSEDSEIHTLMNIIEDRRQERCVSLSYVMYNCCHGNI